MATWGTPAMRQACEETALLQLRNMAAIVQQQAIEDAAQEDGYGFVFTCDAEHMAFEVYDGFCWCRTHQCSAYECKCAWSLL